MTESFKQVYIFAIILTAISFFQLSAIGESGFKILELLGIVLIVVVFVIHFVYDKGDLFPHRFRLEIFLMFFAVFLSMIAAFVWHKQSLQITAIAQRTMYFYIFYFAIHQTRIKSENLQKVILIVAITYTFLFILQFVIYPTIIFESRIDADRGTLRIFLPGLSFLLIGYFYSFNRIINNQEYKYFFLIVPFLIIFILLGTRQILFTVLFITMLNLLVSGTLQSKVLIGFLGIVSLIPLFFAFQEIFNEMIELSQKQADSMQEDVRIRAARFFLTDFMPNRLAYITGNGMHSLNSLYGVEVEGYKENLGFYQSDIGIIGAYSRYGIFFLIAALSIVIRVLISPTTKSVLFVKAYFLYLLITLPISGNEFTSPASIISVLICVYLIEVDRYVRDYKLINNSND
jgi:hypothetical protein